MQTQNFYKLARPVQDRLIGCINGGGLPAPFLATRGGPVEPFVWLLGGGVGAVALVLLYRIGLGALDNSLATHAPAFIVPYALLVAATTFSLVRAAAVLVDQRSLPFKPGVYVFPIGVIDARRFTLKIYPIADLVSSEGPTPSNGFRLTFKGGAKFDFRAKNADAAATAAESIAGARGQLAEAEEAPGSLRPKALAALDPMQGFVNPLAPDVSIERNVPVWSKFGWAIAPAVGLVLGSCLWLVRNVVSDDKMFAHAIAKGDAPSLRAYMAKGSRHKGEVEVVLLPRAELKEAQDKGTVDAIEGYMKAHPKTGIASEIDQAFKKAMLDELETSKKAGTVTALKDFATRHPNHRLDAELKAATHGVYMTALDKYKAHDAPKDPAAVAFVEKLVALAEQRGPKVELRFHRKTSRTLDKADTFIGKNRYFMGTVSFPTKYQDAPHMKPREDELAKTIVARFNEAFPSDVLALSVGEPISDPDGTLPAAVTAPTWFVVYSPEWDGGVKTSDRPRGVFTGVGYAFDATFRLVDESKPLHYKPQIIWRGAKLDGMDAVDRPEERIYADMASSAFEQFGKKLLGTVFASK